MKVYRFERYILSQNFSVKRSQESLTFERVIQTLPKIPFQEVLVGYYFSIKMCLQRVFYFQMAGDKSEGHSKQEVSFSQSDQPQSQSRNTNFTFFLEIITRSHITPY